jgi:hypothetical protein
VIDNNSGALEVPARLSNFFQALRLKIKKSRKKWNEGLTKSGDRVESSFASRRAKKAKAIFEN